MHSRERRIVISHGAVQRGRLKAVISTAVLLVATTLTPTTAFAIGRW